MPKSMRAFRGRVQGPAKRPGLRGQPKAGLDGPERRSPFARSIPYAFASSFVVRSSERFLEVPQCASFFRCLVPALAIAAFGCGPANPDRERDDEHPPADSRDDEKASSFVHAPLTVTFESFLNGE